MIDPNLITTIRYDQLPPGAIDENSLIAVANGTDLFYITGQDLIDFININSNAFQFEKKELYVDQSYIDTNFDATGLGISIMTGWAIVNGQNGTPNDDGLVNVAYGTNYNVINAIGGSKQVTLAKGNIPTIDTTLPVSNAGGGGTPYTYVVASGSGTPATKIYSDSAGSASVSPINNMQPYRVCLRIMKL